MKGWIVWGCLALLGGVACREGGESPGASGALAGEGGAAETGGTHDVPRGGAQEGGAAPCEQGLQRLRIEGKPTLPDPNDTEDVMDVVAWPEQQRVAVNMVDEVDIFDLASANSDRSVRLVQRLSKADVGLSAHDGFFDLFRAGDGLILRTGDLSGRRFLSWQPTDGFAELTRVPSDVLNVLGVLADATHGIVVAGLDGRLLRAQVVDGEWTWQQLGAVPNRRVKPLAFAGDDLLVGIEEIGRGDSGAGGAGGASATDGGAGGEAADLDSAPRSRHALLERWSLDGVVLARYQAVGDPAVAIPARGGWLIGETNSFWGSYGAAVEWLDPAAGLQQLAPVPVKSSSDGVDGAYDLVLHGPDVLVANCESGLRRGRWTSDALELADVAGPWSSDYQECNPSELELVGDVLVVTGKRLDFAQFCE